MADIIDKYSAHANKWPGKNLGEIIGFLKGIYPEGVSGRNLAESLGQAPQGISGLFCKDDMKLSKAEQIADAFGHRLKLFFPVRQQLDWFTPPPPRQSFPEAGNLEGLVQYINDSGWSITHAASRMKVNPNILFRAFKSGDIKISTLKEMLDNIGIVVIWKFIKKNKDND